MALCLAKYKILYQTSSTLILQLFANSPSFIKNNDGIFEGKVKSVIIPKERAIDIDDEVDFLLTKAIYEN